MSSENAMERIVFDQVWKRYDRRYGSNRFRKGLSQLLGGNPERNEFWALQDVSFRLEEGQSLGIVGPNGSGKTTILRVLSGISQINRGHVRVRGSLSALIALGAGFHPELSGRENIYLNGAILGLERSQVHRYFDEIVEFSGIGEYIDSPVKRYSSGMFVRLGFAVAAQISPDILLVDEVLAVGDAQFRSACHRRIRQLREQGTIIVLVSHDLWAVRRSCQQALFLEHGQVRSAGEVSQVLADYNRHIDEQSQRPGSTELDPQQGQAAAHALLDIQFRDEQGQARSEFKYGEPLVIRLYYRCDRPIPRPTLVLSASNDQGVSAFILRSRKENWHVEQLQGSGHVDVHLDALTLAPGNYGIVLHLKDEEDLNPLAASRYRDLSVFPPDLDWCRENCVFVPRARWSEPEQDAPEDAPAI